MKIKKAAVRIEELRSRPGSYNNKKYGIELAGKFEEAEDMERAIDGLRIKCQKIINSWFSEEELVDDKKVNEVFKWFGNPSEIASKLGLNLSEITGTLGAMVLTKRQYEALKKEHDSDGYLKLKKAVEKKGILDISGVFDRLKGNRDIKTPKTIDKGE